MPTDSPISAADPAAWARIGTRGSPLALAQAHEVAGELAAAHGVPRDAIAIVTLQTRGDQVQDRALSAIGGKGLFTKEIDAALLAGEVDFAVHSMKDVPTVPPEGIDFAAVLPREDVRDAFISERAGGLDALPAGALIGTASLRRQAQVLNRRPDLKVSIFRGNVQTRLKKLADGVADATFLALAGLNRLGRADVATEVIETDRMLPAVAQGAVGVAIRAGDDRARSLLAPLHDADAADRIAAERAFLRVLDGSCRTPLAGLAALDDGGGLRFQGEVLAPDGAARFAAARAGSRADAERLGVDAAEEVLAAAGPEFMERLRAASDG